MEIDALKPELITKENCPFLYSLAQKNYSARLQTTLTFTQFVETFVGLKPEESGFWTLFLKDKNSPYKYTKYLLNTKLIDIATNLKLYFLRKTYFFSKSKIPFSIVSKFGTCTSEAICEKGLFKRKTVFDMIKENNFAYIALPFIRIKNKKRYSFLDMSDEKAVKIAMKLSKKNLDFIHLYLKGVDSIQHHNGLNSIPVKKRLRELDSMVEKIYKAFKNTKFMIFSNHGMVNVNKTINIQEILKGVKNYLAFYDSTLARFWCKDKTEIVNALKDIRCGHVLSEAEKRKYSINFKDNRYGDVIFLADPGVLILPNYFQGKTPVKAMHTYRPVKELDGMVIYEGKPHKGLFKERGHILDLFDMIADKIKN